MSELLADDLSWAELTQFRALLLRETSLTILAGFISGVWKSLIRTRIHLCIPYYLEVPIDCVEEVPNDSKFFTHPTVQPNFAKASVPSSSSNCASIIKMFTTHVIGSSPFFPLVKAHAAIVTLSFAYSFFMAKKK